MCLTIVINNDLIDRTDNRVIPAAFWYPLIDKGSILKTSLMCSINGSIDLLLQE